MELKRYSLNENFLSAKKLLDYSLFLLNSDESLRSKEISDKILTACNSLCLNPKEIYIRDSRIFLRCEGYSLDKIMFNWKPTDWTDFYASVEKTVNEISPQIDIPKEFKSKGNRYLFS